MLKKRKFKKPIPLYEKLKGNELFKFLIKESMWGQFFEKKKKENSLDKELLSFMRRREFYNKAISAAFY